MKIKCLFWVTFTMIIAALPLSAQRMAVFAPFVTRLQGEAENNFVRLSWVDSRDVRGPVYIYRSNLPFRGLNSSFGITPVEVPYGAGSYVDTVQTDEILYYFIVASDEKGILYDYPIISNNTTSVQVSDENTIPELYEEFLPFEVQNTSEVLDKPPGTRRLKVPRVFARDLETAQAACEEYNLISIVRGSFAEKNWEASRDELSKLIALSRNPGITARARFYLGQCWYFLRKLRDGLYEFLAIQEKYPAEAFEWIQASLDLMKD